jgi:hypothetical protein
MPPVTIDGTNGITTPMYSGAISANAVTPVNSFKNRIINGNMSVDQRNAGASVSLAAGADQYTLDRYDVQNNTTSGAFTCQQVSTAPAGFINSMKITVTATEASPTSTMKARIYQAIEGLNVADLNWGSATNAKTVTLSFWVQSSVTGTFGGSLGNASDNRAYPFTYTISAANTWEQKSVTIAGDTTGTWATNNTTGILLNISLLAGTSRSGTAGAWNSNWNTSATGATNLLATNGATFYITGVQLEVGSTATSFDYRPYGTELALCQRYYYKLAIGQGNSRALSGYISSTTQSINLLNMPVSMRTSPTALETSGTAAHYSVAYTNTETTCSAVPSYNDASFNTVSVIGPVASGLTPGQGCQLRYINASAYLAVSAEL